MEHRAGSDRPDGPGVRLCWKELSSGLGVRVPQCRRGSQDDKGQRDGGPTPGGPAGARGPCVTGQHLRARGCGGPGERSLVDPGHGAGNEAGGEAAGTDAASGTPGSATRSINTGAIIPATTTTTARRSLPYTRLTPK